MIIQEVGQMVRNEILSGRSQIDRVPELELGADFVERFLFRLEVLRHWSVLKEHVVPKFVVQFLSSLNQEFKHCLILQLIYCLIVVKIT